MSLQDYLTGPNSYETVTGSGLGTVCVAARTERQWSWTNEPLSSSAVTDCSSGVCRSDSDDADSNGGGGDGSGGGSDTYVYAGAAAGFVVVVIMVLVLRRRAQRKNRERRNPSTVLSNPIFSDKIETTDAAKAVEPGIDVVDNAEVAGNANVAKVVS